MARWLRVRRTPLLISLVIVLALGAGTALLVQVATPAEATTVTAKCTDSRADADAIQDVINASDTGDEIIFSGPCLIDATIVLLGGRSYRGESAATTLTAAPGSNLDAVLASDAWVISRRTVTGSPITLRDLTIDANASQNPSGGDGVVIRSWHTLLDNLRITDAAGNGLRITSVGLDGTNLGSGNTQVNGAVDGLFVVDAGKHGIYVEDPGNAVTDWHLRDSWVGGAGQDGIRLDNSAGWTVSGNHTYDVAGSGIAAYRMFSTSLTDNYVEDFGTGSGIAGLVQGSGGSVVEGNRVFQVGRRTGGALLSLVGVASGTSSFTVVGNVLVGNGTNVGLSYQTQGGKVQVTSTGNNVSGVRTVRSLGTGVRLSTSY